MKLKKNALSEVATLITEGMQKWIEAGDILCSYLDDGGSLDEAAESTGMPIEVLRRFVQIGRRQIHPKILASTSPGRRALSLCTYSDQEKYIDTPLRLLVSSGSDAINVEVDNLTSYQCRQVFVRGHIRTDAEQRAWIESEKTKHAVAEDPEPASWMIESGKLVVRKPSSFTRREIKRMLEAMK